MVAKGGVITGGLTIILGADILIAGLLARQASIRVRLDEGVQALPFSWVCARESS